MKISEAIPLVLSPCSSGGGHPAGPGFGLDPVPDLEAELHVSEAGRVPSHNGSGLNLEFGRMNIGSCTQYIGKPSSAQRKYHAVCIRTLITV